MSFKFKYTGNGSNTMHMWETSSTTVSVGKFINNENALGIAQYNNGWTNKKTISTSANVEYLVEYEYDNGVFTCSINGQSVTLTHTIANLLYKLEYWPVGTNSTVKDLKIKPL